MRLLIAVDIDGSEQADFLLVDLRDHAYRLTVKARLQVYLGLANARPDLLSMSFQENPEYLEFYESRNEHSIYPVPKKIDQSRQKVQDGALAGVWRVGDDKAAAEPGIEVLDAEMVIGEEGVFWRAFHNHDATEIVSAPVPICLLEES